MAWLYLHYYQFYKSEYKLTLRPQRALRENILAETAEIAEEFNGDTINYTQ
jgi:hypothetical protein